MKKVFVLTALVIVSLTSQAWIENPLPGKLTSTRGADYRCEQQGGGVAIALPKNGAAAKVWQTEPGEDEGLELKVTSFQLARCPDCLRFEALLLGAVKVEGEMNDAVLSYYAYDRSGKKELLMRVSCQRKPENRTR